MLCCLFRELFHRNSGSVQAFNTKSLEGGELRSEEVNKGLVFAQTIESLVLLFFGRLFVLQRLNISFDLVLEEISFSLIQDMGVFVTHGPTIYFSKVIIHLLHCVFPDLGIFSSAAFQVVFELFLSLGEFKSIER